MQQNRRRECRNLDLQSPTKTALLPIRRPYPFCSVLSRDCFLPSTHNSEALEEMHGGLLCLHPCSWEVHTLSQAVFGISASDRLRLCSQYLAALNCPSFTVCRSSCGARSVAAYGPRCNLDLSLCLHLLRHSPFPVRFCSLCFEGRHRWQAQILGGKRQSSVWLKELHWENRVS